jgi:prephenate dehydrogenase
MEDGFRLQNAKIAIIGLGLMGGSLALALKGKCAALYGIDSDRATVQVALDRGVVDQAHTDAARLLPQVDLVILATPVPAIIDIIHNLPLLVQASCIVLDLGSTKKNIVEAMSLLPERFDPIGGHPICGKEKLGLENADAGLFQHAPFVVTPLRRKSVRAKDAVKQIVSAIGAQFLEIDAEEHDRVLASTSHLPFLLSSALVLSTPQEFASFLGTGYKSTSRLAGTSSHMILGVLQSNRKNLLSALHTFRTSLSQLESALQSENDKQLELLLNQSRSTYQVLITNH